jgi:hypothetical protein
MDAARSLVDGQLGSVTTVCGFAVVGALALAEIFLSTRLFRGADT